jgi:TPP-dependent pyruvate/acetoin dehydrogenase alpha subunit
MPSGLDLEKKQLLELYHFMKMNRMLEDKLRILYRQGKIVGGLYSSLGQEATSIGTAYALEDGDYFAPMIRNLGTTLVRGIPTKDWFAQYMGRVCAPTKGKDGNAHFGDLSKGFVAPISVLGAMIPVLVGMAWTMKLKKQKKVAMTWIGDGGTSTTDFHEGLNFAAVHKLPFVLVGEHNQFAYSTPTEKQFPTEHIADKAKGYGIYGEIVDGNNVLAVYDAARRARAMCLDGNGPVLLEAKTFRRQGHAEHDAADYVPGRLRTEWEAKDPIDAYHRFLLQDELATEGELEDIEKKISDQLDQDVEEVLASPLPDPSIATENVYAPDDNPGGHP